MTKRAAALVTNFFCITLFCGAARAQQQVLPLWPHATPEPPQTTVPETDTTKPTDALFNGHRSQRLTNVTKPTVTVYPPPSAHDTHVAALVFPGGGYQRLAWNGEGTDTCDWLNSIGVTCLLVKYRVPQPEGDAGHYPADFADLEDAQQAMRLARAHAAEWHIKSDRIGVIGYSAGGNLAVLLSTHPDDAHVLSTPAAPDVPTINGAPRDARPDFAIVAYPAYLAVKPEEKDLDPVYAPNKFTPPTFVMQAENDKSYGHNALVYYRALMDAHVPAELHYFATGGHGFGVHPVGTPAEHWTRLATFWLHTTGVLPSETMRHPDDAPQPTSAAARSPAPSTRNPSRRHRPATPANRTPARARTITPAHNLGFHRPPQTKQRRIRVALFYLPRQFPFAPHFPIPSRTLRQGFCFYPTQPQNNYFNFSSKTGLSTPCSLLETPKPLPTQAIRASHTPTIRPSPVDILRVGLDITHINLP